MNATISRMKLDEKGKETGELDPRWTLAMEYKHRGLIRPSQLHKLPRSEQEDYKPITFPWGATGKHKGEKPRMVVGYRR
jgi:hypothetical protein